MIVGEGRWQLLGSVTLKLQYPRLNNKEHREKLHTDVRVKSWSCVKEELLKLDMYTVDSEELDTHEYQNQVVAECEHVYD